MTATITVDATANQQGHPDRAGIELETVGEGETPATARAHAHDRTETIRESITAIPAEQIRTASIEVVETDGMFGPESDAEYHATERLTIECRPAQVEDIVMDVTDVGGTIQSVEFGLRTDTHHRLQDAALTAATERARSKAERIATAEGLDIVGIERISTADVISGMDDLVDEALDESYTADFSPSPVTIAESVEVVYAMTENAEEEI